MIDRTRPLLPLPFDIRMVPSLGSPPDVRCQVRVIDTPNLRPTQGTPSRFDTVMVRANAAPDTATGFATITDVALDSAGHILAVDARGRRLIIPDQSGQVQGVLGPGGAGPGESRVPYLATVAANGTVAVLDETVNRLTLFDRQLQFVRTVPLPGYLSASSMLAVGDELRVAGTLNLPGGENKANHALSFDGAYLRSFGQLVDAATPVCERQSAAGFWLRLGRVGCGAASAHPTWSTAMPWTAPLNCEAGGRTTSCPPRSRPSGSRSPNHARSSWRRLRSREPSRSRSCRTACG
jgi:hypothetical protein